MYRHTKSDLIRFAQRADQFSGQLERYHAGELDEDQFKQLRLRNGLYRERHAYMLRIGIPFGMVDSNQMRLLAHISSEYDRGSGHLTTRQNIQLNWLDLDDIPLILKKLAKAGLHGIQTSGNCVRAITTDPLAGVARDEIEDPRPWCELLHQWSILHPEFNWLPRKIKIAVSGAESDRVATHVHDIGLRIVRNKRGETGFMVVVGGGLGRTPLIGRTIRTFLEKQHLLSYVEAILRVYNLHGDRSHPFRSRLKFMVRKLGIDHFRKLVDKEWRLVKEGDLKLEPGDITSAKKKFKKPTYPGTNSSFEIQSIEDADFSRWLEHNTEQHKYSGYRIVHIPLKAPGNAPGDVSSDQMVLLANLADRFNQQEIRLSKEQNIIFAHVEETHLFELWSELDSARLGWPNRGYLSDITCCPGQDHCSLAMSSSISIAKRINEKFIQLNRLYNVGELKLNISGCINGCGHHHLGHIGILGLEKSGVDHYQILLGGTSGTETRPGKPIGHAIHKRNIVRAIEIVVNVYLEHRNNGESFIQTSKRIGIEPFTQRVYQNEIRPTPVKTNGYQEPKTGTQHPMASE